VSYTKKQLITKAIKDILKTGDDFQPSPEDYEAGLEALDNMVSEWYMSGIRWAYPIPPDPSESNLDDDSGTPPGAVRAVVKNLAIELAPMYGIEPSRATKVSAMNSYENLWSQDGIAEIPEKRMPKWVSRGMGQKYWRWDRNTFFPEPADPVQFGKDGEIEEY